VAPAEGAEAVLCFVALAARKRGDESTTANGDGYCTGGRDGCRADGWGNPAIRAIRDDP